MVSRAEPSLSGRWWWSIDRVILSALVALMVSGVVLLMAGGPPVAERLGLSTFHFVNRQAVYLVAAMTVFVGVSFLTPRQARRVAMVALVISLLLMLAVLLGVVEGFSLKQKIQSVSLHESQLQCTKTRQLGPNLPLLYPTQSILHLILPVLGI